MKKVIILLLMLVLCTSLVVASSDDYDITQVYVNGIEVGDDGKVQVELGSSLQVLMYIEGTGDNVDVKARAWMGGYEYGSIEDISEMFDVEDGVSYKKYLYLDIPEDLDVSDNDYTLYVEVYSDIDFEMETYDLYLEQERHSVVIKDIFLSNSQVEAGDYLGVKVRLENLGENVEKDVRITVSLDGVSARTYVEELGVKGSDSDDEVSSETLYLTIPSDYKGDYELNIEVEYNNGYSTVSKTEWVKVTGNVSYDEDAIVSIASVKDLILREEKTFKVQVTNLGDDSKEFNLFVYGIGDVEYSNSVTVNPGRVGELYFIITPTEEGLQEVVVEVSTEDGIVEERTFNVDVRQESNWFWLGFGLAFIVVFMGVVWYLKR